MAARAEASSCRAGTTTCAAGDRPILCNPYESRATTGSTIRRPERRAAPEPGALRVTGIKTERTGSAQFNAHRLAEEERDDLPLVNALREDVRSGARPGIRGDQCHADLLRHWARADRGRSAVSARSKPSRPSSICRRSGSPERLGIRETPKLGKGDLNRMLAESARLQAIRARTSSAAYRSRMRCGMRRIAVHRQWRGIAAGKKSWPGLLKDGRSPASILFRSSLPSLGVSANPNLSGNRISCK